MSTTELALQMRGVRKTFEAENAPVRALRGVDLDIGRAEFVALTGPSGCGKSTLLNLAAGLDLADEGTIFVAGEEVTGQGEDELAKMRRRHIGIVFQFFNLLESVTVLENVALAAIIAGRKRRVAETRARDLLDLLGLGDKASAVPGVLSGGQDTAVQHANDALGGVRDHAVVGHEQDGLAARVQPTEQLDDLLAAIGVQRSRWLVRQQQRRLVREGPRDG